jgi:hypothetical protein
VVASDAVATSPAYPSKDRQEFDGPSTKGAIRCTERAIRLSISSSCSPFEKAAAVEAGLRPGGRDRVEPHRAPQARVVEQAADLQLRPVPERDGRVLGAESRAAVTKRGGSVREGCGPPPRSVRVSSYGDRHVGVPFGSGLLGEQEVPRLRFNTRRSHQRVKR